MSHKKQQKKTKTQSSHNASYSQIQAEGVQKNKEWKNYKRATKELETSISQLSQNVEKQLRDSLTFHKYFLYGIILICIFGIGLGSWWMIDKNLSERLYLGVGFFIIGLLLLIIISYRNPVKNIRQAMNGYAKVNMITSAYLRQLHQVDVLFKQTITSEKRINPEEIEKYSSQICTIVEQSMTQLLHTLQDDDLFL